MEIYEAAMATRGRSPANVKRDSCSNIPETTDPPFPDTFIYYKSSCRCSKRRKTSKWPSARSEGSKLCQRQNNTLSRALAQMEAEKFMRYARSAKNTQRAYSSPLLRGSARRRRNIGNFSEECICLSPQIQPITLDPDGPDRRHEQQAQEQMEIPSYCFEEASWKKETCEICDHERTGECLISSPYPDRPKFSHACLCEHEPNVADIHGTRVNHSVCVSEIYLRCSIFANFYEVNRHLITEFGFENIVDASAMQSKAKENLMFLVSELDAEGKIDISFMIDETIRQCSFAGKDCKYETDFKMHVDPSFGNCFVFNHNVTDALLAARPGSLYGLRLLLFSNKSEYLSTTDASGSRIAVHHQKDLPFPDMFGFNAPTGFLSSFAVKMKLEALQAPHGKCVPREQFNLTAFHYLYGEYYSMEGCHRSCVQRNCLEKCKCADARFPVPYQNKTCKVTDEKARKCIRQLQEELSEAENVLCRHCAPPCQKTEFSVSFSSAKWPTESSVKSLCEEGEDLKTCFQTYKEQASFVEVFFEQVNYELLKEHEAYGWENLLSDFGGQISLWMGFSVITGIEVVVLLCRVIVVCLQWQPQRRKMGAWQNHHPTNTSDCGEEHIYTVFSNGATANGTTKEPRRKQTNFGGIPFVDEDKI